MNKEETGTIPNILAYMQEKKRRIGELRKHLKNVKEEETSTLERELSKVQMQLFWIEVVFYCQGQLLRGKENAELYICINPQRSTLCYREEGEDEITRHAFYFKKYDLQLLYDAIKENPASTVEAMGIIVTEDVTGVMEIRIKYPM